MLLRATELAFSSHLPVGPPGRVAPSGSSLSLVAQPHRADPHNCPRGKEEERSGRPRARDVFGGPRAWFWLLVFRA